MRKQTFFSERIYPVIFMIVVTVVFISAISGIHIATQAVVLENETIYLKKAVLLSVGVPVPEDNAKVNKIYDSNVKEYDFEGQPSVFIYSGGGSERYAFRITGPGLWGRN